MASDGAAEFRQPTRRCTNMLSAPLSEITVILFFGKSSGDLEPDKTSGMPRAGMSAILPAMRYTLDVSRRSV